MEIKKVKLADIKPYFNNPRNNQAAIAPTAESIKRYGFIKPIICDKNGVIIAGHTRYIAAFQLGMTEVPVIYTDMDEEKAKEFRIADNKLAEKSSFDENQLIEELRKLDVPEEMQSFFFEDVHDMINFNADSFGLNAQSDYGDDYGDQSESEETDTMSDEGMVQRDPADIAANQEANGEGDVGDNTNAEEEEDGVSYNDLYKVTTHPDGRRTLKVLCPYCGNIEDVELKD